MLLGKPTKKRLRTKFIKCNKIKVKQKHKYIKPKW